MRQSHAGDTVSVIIDRLTGKIRPAQIFVAVLGASNFTPALASGTQALADWIGAHTRIFAAIGGVPRLLVPDNTKVAVIKACFYEPQVNRSYAERSNPVAAASLIIGERISMQTQFLVPFCLERARSGRT